MKPGTRSAATAALAGRRVVVTRPRDQATGLIEALESLGAEVMACPLIRIEPAPDPAALLRAAQGAGRFDWLVFTSANGVEAFWEALLEAGRGAADLTGAAVCAVGPATAAALRERGVAVDVVPERYLADAVGAAMAATGQLRGARVLLPRAAVARNELPAELRERGAAVVEIVAYRTTPDGAGAAALREHLGRGPVDLIIFASGSAVRSFVEQIGMELRGAAIASIGPSTSAVARELGVPVALEAEEHSADGLVRAVREHFAGGGSG